MLLSKLILSQQNYILLLRCFKILCKYQRLENLPCQKHQSANDSLNNHVNLLSLDNKAQACITCIIEVTGKLVVKQQPYQTCTVLRVVFALRRFLMVFMQALLDTVKFSRGTMCIVWQYLALHMSVRICLCGPHVFVCKGNGWQWKMWPILILIASEKRPLYLWALSRWTAASEFKHESIFLITIKKCVNMTAILWS